MFDGYHQWLRIPKDQRPPTLYQLLAIAPDEQDAEVIRRAVIEKSARVRIYQAGAHAEECRQILDEIASACLTLLNPAKRERYDAQLIRATTPAGRPAQNGQPTRDDRPAVPHAKPPEAGIEVPDQLPDHDWRSFVMSFGVVGVFFLIGLLSVFGFHWLRLATSPGPPQVTLSLNTDTGKAPSPVRNLPPNNPGALPSKRAEPRPISTDGPTSGPPVAQTPKPAAVVRGLVPKPPDERPAQPVAPAPDPDPDDVQPQPPAVPANPQPKPKKAQSVNLPQNVLERNGLKTSRGGLFSILEAEEQVEAKKREAAAQLAVFENAAARQRAFEMACVRLKNLNDESSLAQKAIADLDVLIPRMPRVNNFDKQSYREAVARRDQLRLDQNQRQLDIQTMRQILPPWQERPKVRDQMKGETENHRAACQATMRGLRQLVDAARAKYKDLAADDQVKRAIAALGRKLGPSKDFQENAEWLRRAEKRLR